MVAIDCEMVGLGHGQGSGLARCSLVDINGTVLYDKFIRPEGEIMDYRTRFSGITPRNMEAATPFAVAKQEVSRELSAGQAGLPHTHPCAHFSGTFSGCQVCDL